MRAHLLLVLEAPLQAWGTVAVDAYGRIDDFPTATLVVGLLGNALGWDRTDSERLDALQSRLVLGAAILRGGHRLTDPQNAKLEHSDRGWTTRGRPEGRAGGANTYKSPHRRFRDYAADAAALVALRLEPDEATPRLHDLADALAEPERPVFLGRKACPPARPVLVGTIEADTVIDALEAAIKRVRAGAVAGLHPLQIDEGPVRARWPEAEGDREGSRIVEICDDRDWRNDVHVGMRRRRVADLHLAAEVSEKP